MKKRIKVVLILGVLFLTSNSLFAQKTFGSAVEYMNFISEQYAELTDDQWSYTKAVANDKSARKVEGKRQDLLKTNKGAQKKISSLSGYGGNTEYRDSIVSFLELNYNVLNYDYAKIMDMEDIADQSYDLMEAYLLAQEIASQKINAASDMLTLMNQKFADDNDITLLESQSKKGEKLAKAGKMYKYYNKVYLIFFKAYKQEAYFMNALNKGDVGAMAQTKNALLEYAEEGIKLLKEVKAFDGDNALKEACLNSLNFYKKEATDHSGTLIDFFLKKEKFESIQKAFNGKKEKDRTKDDVEQFNEAVNNYNNASNEYNSTNEVLNKSRGKSLDNWNNSSTKFTKKHV